MKAAVNLPLGYPLKVQKTTMGEEQGDKGEMKVQKGDNNLIQLPEKDKNQQSLGETR